MSMMLKSGLKIPVMEETFIRIRSQLASIALVGFKILPMLPYW